MNVIKPKDNEDYIKGRGAQVNTHNRFHKQNYVTEYVEGLDEPWEPQPDTEFIMEHPKKVLNRVDSPDIGNNYSINPYQGCEHGCIYCYARPTHEYWGLSAGLDFEKKIIVKANAPELLEKEICKKNYELRPIMLSGNTDCYQPAERRFRITRRILEVLLKHRHPVGVITKNALILRDLDILAEMNSMDLVHVSITMTSLNEELRQKLEPRTAAVKRKLQVIKTLSDAGIPVNIMMAPIIPGLNMQEIPELVKTVSERGALSVGYTIVRLNGALQLLFDDWVRRNFPDRADKILHQVAECHGGQLNDSRFGIRMRGEGKFAELVAQLFRVARATYLKDKVVKPYNASLFQGYVKPQLDLF